MRLAYGNKLPPKKIHLDRVKAALTKHGNLKQSQLVAISRLTKTQTLCALDRLLLEKEIKFDPVKKMFGWVGKED